MPIKNTSYPIRSYSKKELARAYGVTDKIFRGWCKRAGFDFGRVNQLTPKQVRQVFEAFDAPE